MADRMQRYVRIAGHQPDKRAPAERAADFREIRDTQGHGEAAEQASRCEQCGVPYCQVFCPLHNNILDWLKAVAEGRTDDAYALAQATNTFPEICGRICPQDRLCEAKWACTLEQAEHGTVTIGAVERHIGDTAWDEGWVTPRTPRRETGFSVAVVGGGPGGLAAAEELRAVGHAVTVYDAHDRLGGLMTYGIPSFKMEKHVVDRRVELIAAAGVAYRPNTVLGRDVTLAGLRAAHHAVFLAFGAYRARQLDVPGSGLAGVEKALDFLIDGNRRARGEPATEHLDAHGRRVVVVGGGDTAMDCVRTAVREGAARVTCLYRRDRDNMPGSAREVTAAEEEGVQFLWQAQPEAVEDVPVEMREADATHMHGDGCVDGLRAVLTRLVKPVAGGRARPEPVPGSAFTVDADLVINALGFEVADPGLSGVQTTSAGTLKVDPRNKETSLPGVFAGGDAVRGPSLAVWAIRDGRDAAEGIAKYLGRTYSPELGREPVGEPTS